MTRLDSDSRKQIIEMMQAGLSQHEVAERFKVKMFPLFRGWTVGT